MWVSIRMIRRMDMGSSHGSQEMFIRAITWMMRGRGMERCILWMELFIKGIGQEDYRQVRLL